MLGLIYRNGSKRHEPEVELRSTEVYICNIL